MALPRGQPGFLDQGERAIRVRLPAVPFGTIYNVAVAIASAEADSTPGDNTISAQVKVEAQTYLPLAHQ